MAYKFILTSIVIAGFSAFIVNTKRIDKIGDIAAIVFFINLIFLLGSLIFGIWSA
jgi:hypothetical protein